MSSRMGSEAVRRDEPDEWAPPPAAKGAANGTRRVRTYEELDGAEGRAVFFRPHRYTAADLAPLECMIEVATTEGWRESPLRDVSQNGAAFTWPDGEPPQPRRRIELALRFDTHQAFRGSAHVGSVRQQGGSTVVGVSFDDFLLDVEEILQLRTVRAWSIENSGASAQQRAWYVPESDRFKALVSELRLLLEDAERRLGALERDFPWHVLHGTPNPAHAALVSRLQEGLVPEIVGLSEQIDAAVRELPQGHKNAAAKEWSLRHLDAYLMQAPVLHRARYKPFGYPGDYEVMNVIYERRFEGATLFARAVGLALGTESRAAVAVRTRKDLVKTQLRALLAKEAGRRTPVRVLSIAAGPAQELSELLAEVEELPVELEVVLFEQDKNALTQAWRRLKGAVELRHRGAIRLQFLHDSIKRLLRDPDLFSSFGKFDLTYSCGLYDYLQRPTSVALTRHLSRAVAKAGRVLVANMVDHPARWLMEHHLEWPLIYRTREELIEIGRRAVPHAQLRILEEESGVNPFLELLLS
jgi:extracellular factor (EF) 3-hydroxypalmitic acid methyl ester biosynthesis protein